MTAPKQQYTSAEMELARVIANHTDEKRGLEIIIKRQDLEITNLKADNAVLAEQLNRANQIVGLLKMSEAIELAERGGFAIEITLHKK